MSHNWVKIVITPVHVIDDPAVSDQPVVLITDDDQQEADACAQYGCLSCDETLTSDTLNEPCPADALTT